MYIMFMFCIAMYLFYDKRCINTVNFQIFQTRLAYEFFHYSGSLIEIYRYLHILK